MVLIHYWHYIEINIGDFDPIPSTLQSLSIHILTSQQQMEYAKGVALGAWDRLPEEVVSIITIKVAKILEAPLKDICTRRLCNKEMKRACSSRVVANRFNLENHYQSMVWGERHWLDADLQTVDWLQGTNNAEALFVKGMDGICTGHPGGVVLLARAEEEGDLQHITCWPLSSTTGTAPSRMYSSTSSACMVSPLLVHWSEDGGRRLQGERHTC
jgi:hypothetical protein